MTTSNYLYDLHNIYQTWLNELALANDEVEHFRSNLEKVATANNKVEVTARIEQFQNQFTTHLNELQTLRHDVNAAEAKIRENVTENPVSVDHRKMEMDEALNDRMQQFTKLFRELKNDFNAFLAKTM
jgi:Asp-tRNA(Asn)/Glu-tRNA(Gln) amidotransferase C subunit